MMMNMMDDDGWFVRRLRCVSNASRLRFGVSEPPAKIKRPAMLRRKQGLYRLSKRQIHNHNRIKALRK